MDKSVPREGILHSMKIRKQPRELSQSAEAETSPGAFDAIFKDHWASVYRHLVRLVGDPAEAEDLALEAFLRLYQRKPDAQSEFNFGGWLYRVATNLGLQSIRSFKRREHYELTAGKGALEETSNDQPAKIQADEEEKQLARLVLSRMNSKQSQLLIMRYSGMSYKEIAGAMKLSPTSIGPLLLRAEREFEKRFRALNQEKP